MACVTVFFSDVRSRSFFLRLMLALLGMLFFCLAGYLALGWAVREMPPWFVDRLGEERCVDLYFAYGRTLATVFPADSDGDGTADSAEWYFECDPHDPLNRPDTTAFDQRGFEGSVVYPSQMGLENQLHLVEPGERRRVRIRLGILNRPAVFAAGMQLVLWPYQNPNGSPSPLLLASPGGTLSGKEILVPVTTDGAVDFDLGVAADAELGPASFARTPAIVGRHARLSANPASMSLDFVVGWRQPPLPYTIEDVPYDGPLSRRISAGIGLDMSSVGQPLPKRMRTVRLTWQPAGPTGWQFIEATRDALGQEWFPVGVCPAEEHHCVIAYRLDSQPGYRGPLQFRVVPTKPLPPRE